MTLDELEKYGMVRMTDEEIGAFLSNETSGVLGLAGEDLPYLLPMSYGFDGDSTLYFTYVLGATSRKERLTEAGEPARFLVYAARTPFNWQSALLSGELEPLPEGDRGELADDHESAWRPEIFERATASERVERYRFRVRERSGIKHTGLPPEFTSE